MKHRTVIFHTLFMSPTDSICEIKTNIPTERQKRRQKSLCEKVYKSDGTNTVLSHAFPSTLISQRCFLRIWGVENYILMAHKIATSWKINRIPSFPLNNRLGFH